MNKKNKTCFGLVFFVLLFGIFTPLFSTYLTVTAQDTAFIEVYVYEAESLSPIYDASIDLYDYDYILIASINTDTSGFCNFTDLATGDYIIQVYAQGYAFNDSFLTIDYEGEKKVVEFYLPIPYTPGNGYFELYVLDAGNFSAIPNANVGLYTGDSSIYIDSGLTDVNGFYNFTGLGVGQYWIFVDAENYRYNESYPHITYDGEGVYLEILLAPKYTPGLGYLEVYVYDSLTLNPIQSAWVTFYTEYYYFIIDGYVDINGLFNCSNLGPGNYIIEASADKYYWNETTAVINYDGEGVIIELYLDPVVYTLSIESPMPYATVEGGSVLCQIDVSDSYELDYIDIYVNDVFITTFNYPYIDEFFVPVFENGTNTIYIEGHFYDLSVSNDSVEINSVNVIPIVNLKEGDILNMEYLSLSTTEGAEYNFTFVEWLSPFEMNTLVSLRSYDETGTTGEMNYYIVINVLNGYVSVDPTSMFLYQKFFAFANLVPNPIIGDNANWVYWFDMMTINGSKSWEYTEVWTLTYFAYPNSVLYVEKSSNLIYYLILPGQIKLNIIETTIDFINPDVVGVANFDYIVGATGNTIDWSATDMNPHVYTVYINPSGGPETVYTSGYWDSNNPIVVDVDGLSVDIYSFRIVVEDLAGNTAEDTVVVTVNPVISEFIPVLSLLLIPLMLLVTLVYNRFKKKNSR